MKNTMFNNQGRLCGSEMNRRAALCHECMSEHCVFNPEGICTVPLITGRKADVTEDGCMDWKCNEK